MFNYDKETSKKKYDKLYKKFKKINKIHLNRVNKAQEDLMGAFTWEDFKKLAKTPIVYINKFLENIPEDVLRKTLKYLGPILTILGVKKAIQHINEYAKRSDPALATYGVIISLWASLFMSVVESYYYYTEIDKEDSLTREIYEEVMENRRRMWDDLKNFRLLEVTWDFIKTYFLMWYKMIVWQVEIVKKNYIYATLFSINVIANLIIIYHTGKFLKGKVSSDMNRSSHV